MRTAKIIVLVLGAMLKNRFGIVTFLLRIFNIRQGDPTNVGSCAWQPFMSYGGEGIKESVFLGNCWPFDELKILYQMFLVLQHSRKLNASYILLRPVCVLWVDSQLLSIFIQLLWYEDSIYSLWKPGSKWSSQKEGKKFKDIRGPLTMEP